MFLDGPQTSSFDWRFRLAGIPVCVSPWFWLTALLLGGGASGNGKPQLLALWVAACFLSILIHELGHAMAFRFYGIDSQIVLYQFGGLAIPTRGNSNWGRSRGPNQFRNIIISAAGPLAQIASAAALIIGIRLSGFGIPLYGFVGEWLKLPDEPRIESVQILAFSLFYLEVSIYWAILNLLPVLPLDGGQIARELFLLYDRSDPIKHSLMLSVFTAGLLAVRGFSQNEIYFGMMFGMLAYSNYTALEAHSGSSGGIGRRW